MAQIIFIIFLIVPAVLGLAEILHYLKQLILSPDYISNIFCITVLSEENAVLELSYFCNENNWSRMRHSRKLYAVYNKLSNDIFDECKAIADNNGVSLLSSDKIGEILKELL